MNGSMGNSPLVITGRYGKYLVSHFTQIRVEGHAIYPEWDGRGIAVGHQGLSDLWRRIPNLAVREFAEKIAHLNVIGCVQYEFSGDASFLVMSKYPVDVVLKFLEYGTAAPNTFYLTKLGLLETEFSEPLKGDSLRTFLAWFGGLTLTPPEMYHAFSNGLSRDTRIRCQAFLNSRWDGSNLVFGQPSENMLVVAPSGHLGWRLYHEPLLVYDAYESFDEVLQSILDGNFPPDDGEIVERSGGYHSRNPPPHDATPTLECQQVSDVELLEQGRKAWRKIEQAQTSQVQLQLSDVLSNLNSIEIGRVTQLLRLASASVVNELLCTPQVLHVDVYEPMSEVCDWPYHLTVSDYCDGLNGLEPLLQKIVGDIERQYPHKIGDWRTMCVEFYVYDSSGRELVFCSRRNGETTMQVGIVVPPNQ